MARVKEYVLVALGSLLLGSLVGYFSPPLWGFLNKSSGAIQALSTLVLVGITIFYAKESNKLISLQIFPNIFIVPHRLYTEFLEPESVTEMNNRLNSNSFEPYIVHCILKYSVSNHSASSGSIEKPQLIISDQEGKIKKIVAPDLRNETFDPTGEIKNTLYLNAGETKNFQQNYFLHFIFPKEDSNIIYKAKYLQYEISHRNVTGSKVVIPISNDRILPLQKVYDLPSFDLIE